MIRAKLIPALSGFLPIQLVCHRVLAFPVIRYHPTPANAAFSFVQIRIIASAAAQLSREDRQPLTKALSGQAAPRWQVLAAGTHQRHSPAIQRQQPPSRLPAWRLIAGSGNWIVRRVSASRGKPEHGRVAGRLARLFLARLERCHPLLPLPDELVTPGMK